MLHDCVKYNVLKPCMCKNYKTVRRLITQPGIDGFRPYLTQMTTGFAQFCHMNLNFMRPLTSWQRPNMWFSVFLGSNRDILRDKPRFTITPSFFDRFRQNFIRMATDHARTCHYDYDLRLTFDLDNRAQKRDLIVKNNSS